MKLTAKPVPVILCLFVGAVIGSLGGSAIVLLPWAIIGIVIGVLAVSRWSSVYNGAAYGFALSYSFMITGYNGKDSLTTKLAPFLILGIVGAICGVALALIAFYIKRLTRH